MMVMSIIVLIIAAVIGAIFYTASLYQQPPASLQVRQLTCAAKPQLCSLDETAPSPEHPTRSGRWKHLGPLGSKLEGENSLDAKRWQFVSIVDDRYFVGAALVRFSYISDVFLCVVDRQTQEHWEYTDRLPLGLGVVAASSPTTGCSKWGNPKSNVLEESNSKRPWIEICARTGGGFRFRANVPLTSQDGKNSRRGQIDVTMHNNEDFVLLYPVNGVESQLMFVLKLAGMTVSPVSFLRLTKDDQDDRHNFVGASAGLDWTRGRANYRTFWRWVSLNYPKAKVSRPGSSTQEEFVGINISEEVYDVEDDAGNVFSAENVIWIGGKLLTLKHGVEIQVPQSPRQAMWYIKTRPGLATDQEHVDLQFTPWGAREDHTNYGILLSDYIQPYGTFKGTLVVDGIKIEIDQDAFGVVEDHKAYW